jgi:hypothetical protein
MVKTRNNNNDDDVDIDNVINEPANKKKHQYIPDGLDDDIIGDKRVKEI